jgi:acyl dehydratase
MLDRNAIGRASPPAVHEVEKSAIRRFADATGAQNPIHLDEGAARAAGYRGLVAPLTFPASFHAGADLLEMLKQSTRNVLHAEQTYEFARHLVAGDRITVTARIGDVAEKMGATGPMDVVVLEEEGRDEQGTLVYRARQTLIVRASREATTT